MLKVWFSKEKKKEVIYDIDSLFRSCSVSEWFEDDIVKQMVRDIDNTEIINGNCADSPTLGIIPLDWLSGGVKLLILLYKGSFDDLDFMPSLSYLGENCQKWLLYIAERHDVEFFCHTHEINFYGYDNVHGVSMDTGREFHTWCEWIELLIDEVSNDW